jgi:hypothetical protein
MREVTEVVWRKSADRRHFIGRSDDRIIMKISGSDAITGRMAIACSVIALCYATAAILLVSWPWNFLLLLLLFPSKRVRFQHYG